MKRNVPIYSCSCIFYSQLAGMFTTDSVSNVLCGIKNNAFEDNNSLFASLTRELFRSSFLENLNNIAVFLFPEFSRIIGVRQVALPSNYLIITVIRKFRHT